ncbi:MAG TPA: FtsQ-type POTRA domain-containing protein [Verrucomicrobiae bacterium]|nr:FtsQ-type POTRA domain-containing protein [Verrucomicrobiae bacterium]
MAKVKKVEPEAYPQEVLAEEEPRYLRRQKPVEIRRRKFGKKAWKGYLRVSLMIVAAAAGTGVLYAGGDFLFTSPAMALANPSQVEIRGNHYVTRSSVLELFSPDRGRSVLRIPLGERRAQIEALPWVQSAVVRRALPNHVQVQIAERKPVAFLREGTELMLVDAQGVILDRPVEGNFHFPVVTGMNSAMPLDARAHRMQMMTDFMKQIREVRADAGDSVSEVDLSDATDLQATLAGLDTGSAQISGAVLVHFGNADFHDKFQVLLNNIVQWQAAAGRIASVDLRFEREVVVNPENPSPAALQPVNAKVSVPSAPRSTASARPVQPHSAPPKHAETSPHPAPTTPSARPAHVEPAANLAMPLYVASTSHVAPAPHDAVKHKVPASHHAAKHKAPARKAHPTKANRRRERRAKSRPAHSTHKTQKHATRHFSGAVATGVNPVTGEF